jgi:hypothetical protein
MASRTVKLFAVAAVLFAAFAAIGYYAVKSSSYMTVSQVLKLEHEAKVTVKGYLAGLKTDVRGGRLYLLLEDPKTGDKLLAIADIKFIESRYGPIQYLQWDPNNIVVEGIYDPASKTLTITNILQGCHSSYGQQAVRT